jgi:arylformamidase
VKRIIDISVPVYTGMVYYPGDSGAEIKPYRQISQGDTANLSDLRLGSHTGTHVDAPHHFNDGMATVDELPLDVLVGPARVLDLTRVQSTISPADLEAAGLGEAVRVLLKTRNSGLWQEPGFNKDYVSLSDEAADKLLDRRVRLVGIDYLSIERFAAGAYHVHHALLGAAVVVLEGLDLGSVEPGDYELVCLPLKLRGGDGAPARAILIER